ncbi:fumarylacetoacetate hydrolase family protein [Pseudooceanicola spongiae]|uniref:Fumarylacetoacetate hydrolase family protein n=1 Tax=Pseudooceanicola spongiae TaxID=2613965 RepID=A0A7L9WJQ3_9RHOB|nr:fumarylacetoacetate hydrolase family protein [Pseudooceanicola spongiae]QOL80133.1 fumarylacetoacetate hydrolase family protein [Pseudooceanicola spongiae]
MKLATFDAGHGPRLGALTQNGDALVDLTATGLPALASMQALIEAGDAGLKDAQSALAAGTGLALDSVTLLAPLPCPPQIRDASTAPRHIKHAPVGMRRLAALLEGQPDPGPAEGSIPDIYRAQPIFYITNRFSVAGPEADIHWPSYSKYMDYELEVAVIIGKGGRDIKAENAMEHVFGYTIFNDFSARDTQLREMQGLLGPAKGKSFDAGNVFGPWIVTRDEILDYRALRCTAHINGRLVTDSRLGEMLHGFEDMIAFISDSETLHPGEIIGSGTVDDGCGLERCEFLSDGDDVALTVDGIGTLRNRIVAKG